MPYYRHQIETILSPDATISRIGSLIGDAPQGFWASLKYSFKSPERPFLGKIDGYSFKVSRDIRYRNSFLPRIHGQVDPAPAGSMITLSMTLHPFVAIFMLFWLSFTGVGAWQAVNTSQGQDPTVLVPIGMFIFGIMLVTLGFFPEAIKARRLIENEVNRVGT